MVSYHTAFQSHRLDVNPQIEFDSLFLDRARTYLSKSYMPRIEECLSRLTDEQIWWRPNRTSNSIGNLVLHLSGNVRQWIMCGVGGEADVRERPKEFEQEQFVKRNELLKRLRLAVDEADSVIRGLRPFELSERRTIQGNEVSIFEAIFHVVEHFSMHTGQIILLTKYLTAKDLAFYEINNGTARAQWSPDIPTP